MTTTSWLLDKLFGRVHVPEHMPIKPIVQKDFVGSTALARDGEALAAQVDPKPLGSRAAYKCSRCGGDDHTASNKTFHPRKPYKKRVQ